MSLNREDHPYREGISVIEHPERLFRPYDDHNYDNGPEAMRRRRWLVTAVGISGAIAAAGIVCGWITGVLPL